MEKTKRKMNCHLAKLKFVQKIRCIVEINFVFENFNICVYGCTFV